MVIDMNLTGSACHFLYVVDTYLDITFFLSAGGKKNPGSFAISAHKRDPKDLV